MKKCKDCLKLKDDKDFYGVQGECKECTKKRVKLREEKLRLDPDWLMQEQKRHREKYHRLNYKEKHKPTPEQKKAIIDRYKNKYPEKYKAKNASQYLKKEIQSNHLHHWSYNKKHWKDVIELSEKNHNTLHRFLKYDKETFLYKDLKGNLLDTKEKHLEYFEKIIQL